MKQCSADDRLNQTLRQRHELLLARQKLEQQRADASGERLLPIMEENHRLTLLVDQLHRQSAEINPTSIAHLSQKVHRLRQLEQTLIQKRTGYEHSRKHLDRLDEQLRTKNHRLTLRMSDALNRLRTNETNMKENATCIQALGKQPLTSVSEEMTWVF